MFLCPPMVMVVTRLFYASSENFSSTFLIIFICHTYGTVLSQTRTFFEELLSKVRVSQLFLAFGDLAGPEIFVLVFSSWRVFLAERRPEVSP
jgi:hypothetical protein